MIRIRIKFQLFVSSLYCDSNCHYQMNSQCCGGVWQTGSGTCCAGDWYTTSGKCCCDGWHAEAQCCSNSDCPSGQGCDCDAITGCSFKVYKDNKCYPVGCSAGQPGKCCDYLPLNCIGNYHNPGDILTGCPASTKKFLCG
jgi:hypothetical protein